MDQPPLSTTMEQPTPVTTRHQKQTRQEQAQQAFDALPPSEYLDKELFFHYHMKQWITERAVQELQKALTPQSEPHFTDKHYYTFQAAYPDASRQVNNQLQQTLSTAQMLQTESEPENSTQESDHDIEELLEELPLLPTIELQHAAEIADKEQHQIQTNRHPNDAFTHVEIITNDTTMTQFPPQSKIQPLYFTKDMTLYDASTSSDHQTLIIINLTGYVTQIPAPHQPFIPERKNGNFQKQPYKDEQLLKHHTPLSISYKKSINTQTMITLGQAKSVLFANLDTRQMIVDEPIGPCSCREYHYTIPDDWIDKTLAYPILLPKSLETESFTIFPVSLQDKDLTFNLLYVKPQLTIQIPITFFSLL